MAFGGLSPPASFALAAAAVISTSLLALLLFPHKSSPNRPFPHSSAGDKSFLLRLANATPSTKDASSSATDLFLAPGKISVTTGSELMDAEVRQTWMMQVLSTNVVVGLVQYLLDLLVRTYMYVVVTEGRAVGKLL
jgi:hypothetical protein